MLRVMSAGARKLVQSVGATLAELLALPDQGHDHSCNAGWGLAPRRTGSADELGIHWEALVPVREATDELTCPALQDRLPE